jgi:hypothetical protein
VQFFHSLAEQHRLVLSRHRRLQEVETCEPAPGSDAAFAEAVEVECSQHVVDGARCEDDPEAHRLEPIAELDVLERDHLLVEATAREKQLTFERDAAAPKVMEVQHVSVTKAGIRRKKSTDVGDEVEQVGYADGRIPRRVAQCGHLAGVFPVHVQVLRDESRIGGVIVLGQDNDASTRFADADVLGGRRPGPCDRHVMHVQALDVLLVDGGGFVSRAIVDDDHLENRGIRGLLCEARENAVEQPGSIVRRDDNAGINLSRHSPVSQL